VPVRSPTRCRRCHRLHPGLGLCPECRRARYLDYRWVYDSPQWAELRDQVLSEEPLCADCRAAPPEDIDHIRTLREAPRLAFVRSNVHGLCKPCHGRKTRREG
jgi:5-methylcytosine-specific restriction endonuclease McrA